MRKILATITVLLVLSPLSLGQKDAKSAKVDTHHFDKAGACDGVATNADARCLSNVVAGHFPDDLVG